MRYSACHAGGRGFESRPLRQIFLVNQGLTKSPLRKLRAFLSLFGFALAQIWYNFAIFCNFSQWRWHNNGTSWE